jgi:hypothetical protein
MNITFAIESFTIMDADGGVVITFIIIIFALFQLFEIRCTDHSTPSIRKLWH